MRASPVNCGEQMREPEVRPEYIAKLKRIKEKDRFTKVDDIRDFLKDNKDNSYK